MRALADVALTMRALTANCHTAYGERIFKARERYETSMPAYNTGGENRRLLDAWTLGCLARGSGHGERTV